MLPSFLFGVLGGIFGELLKWYAMRESPNLPEYVRSPFYWIVTLLMVLAGGGLVMIQGVSPENPWLAINVGITAPLILKGFASAVPVKTPSQGGISFSPDERPKPGVIDFIAGR
jgi:hypothetical protein